MESIGLLLSETSPLQGLLALLMMLMLLVVAGRRRDVPVQRLLGHGRRPVGPSLLAATMLLVLLWAACGGGSSSPPPPTGTPAGTYNLTLTAMAGGVSKTSTLALTVN